MPDNNAKRTENKSLDAELFSSEAYPAEETRTYGDETDTPARARKKSTKKTRPASKRKRSGQPHADQNRKTLFSVNRFQKPIGFFEWMSGAGRRESRGRTIKILGHEITFWPFFLVLMALVLVGAIVLDNASIQVDSNTVTIVGLPADLEGYTLLVISDLNGSRFGDEQNSLLRRIQSLDYDCVFLLGDMVGKGGDAQPLYELLEGLGTRKPVYFICGDSDPGPYVPTARNITGTLEQMLLEDWILGAMERGAIYVDSPICIEVDSAKLWLSPATMLNINAASNQARYEDQVAQETDGVLAGLDADYASIPYTTYRKQLAVELATAVANMNATDVHLSLAHQVPSDELIDASCAHDATSKTYLTEADLILAGHSCGGVMRLPLIGAFYIDNPSLDRYGWFPAKEDVSGLSVVSESHVYITKGLSTNSNVPLMPFRLLNQPQISVITLTAKLPDSMLG